MKRKIKLLSMALVILLALLTAVPAMAETLTVHFLQDESKPADQRFDFKSENVVLGVYQIGTGTYGNWKIHDVYKDIKIFDSNNAFQKNSLTEIRKVIQQKIIQPVATGQTQAADAANGVAAIKVTEQGLYFVMQIGFKTNGGTVRTSDMMMATGGADTVNAKWEFTPKPVEQEQPPEERPYKLTIYYKYVHDGSTAFPTHREIDLWPGYRYNVPSPIHPDYNYTRAVVDGVMPHHDMEYTVWYYKVPDDEIPIEDYDTPLGLGNIQMHVGVCYE